MRFGISVACAMLLAFCAAIAQSIVVAADVEMTGAERALHDELAYVGPDGGLWLAEVGRGPKRLLLAQGEFLDFYWSPDGRRIGYQSADGGLSVLDVVSGRRARVTDMVVEEVSWSPDGDSLLFSSDQHLWTASMRGGKPTRLTDWTPEDGERIGRSLWTSDGKYVAYQMSRRGTRELGVIDVKTRRGQVIPLASSPGSLEAGGVTPDGRSLIIPHWEQGETTETVCRRFGLPASAQALPSDSGQMLTQVVEVVTLPSFERKAVACWSLSESDAESTGFLPPTFLRGGQVALVSTVDAPSGLVAIDRSGKILDPGALNLMSLAEEAGRVQRRYPTEVVSNGQAAAVAYRQDESHAEGVWFSFELHFVESAGSNASNRQVVLMDGCFCPDEQADTNIADIQLSPDASRIAFSYFQNGVNRVGVVGVDGQLVIVGDGERPAWRPS